MSAEEHIHAHRIVRRSRNKRVVQPAATASASAGVRGDGRAGSGCSPVLSPLGAARGQSDAARQAADRFTVRDEMIPMRDGVRLHTQIFVPKDQREPLPFMMNRTPYGIERRGGTVRRGLQGAGRRGLHLRVPGHPREVRLGGHVRHAAPGAGAGRHEGPRRGHGHVRHDRLAAEERAAATTGASGCSACPTTAGRRSWARSSRTRRSRRSRRRRRPPTCGSATTSTTTAHSA